MNDTNFEGKKERSMLEAVDDIESGRYKDMPEVYPFLRYATGEPVSSSISQLGPDRKVVRSLNLAWDDEAKRPIEGMVHSIQEMFSEKNEQEGTTTYIHLTYNREGEKYFEHSSTYLGDSGSLLYDVSKDGKGNLLKEGSRENKMSGPWHEVRYAPAGVKKVEIVFDLPKIIYLDGEGKIIETQIWKDRRFDGTKQLTTGELVSRKNEEGKDLSTETIYGGEPWSPAILNGGGPELVRQHKEFMNEVRRKKGKE